MKQYDIIFETTFPLYNMVENYLFTNFLAYVNQEKISSKKYLLTVSATKGNIFNIYEYISSYPCVYCFTLKEITYTK